MDRYGLTLDRRKLFVKLFKELEYLDNFESNQPTIVYTFLKEAIESMPLEHYEGYKDNLKAILRSLANEV